MAWKKHAFVGAEVCLSLGLSGCTPQVYNAILKLDNLVTLDSARFGHLNTTFVTTGDLILLNTKAKTGTHVGLISASTTPTVEFDTVDAAAGNSLNVQFSADITDVNLKAALTTAIQDSTAISLTNPSGVEIGDLVDPLNTAAAISQLDPLYSSLDQDHILVIVTKLIKADDMKFTLQGATSVNGSVSQVKFGQVTVSVNYTDNASLELAAQQSAQRNSGVFFKVAKIIKDSGGKYIPTDTNDLSLSGYDLGNTLKP